MVIGDSLISSSFISYAGPFTKAFREKLIENDFISYFNQHQIPRTNTENITKLLVDDAQKAQWNNQKLPED